MTPRASLKINPDTMNQMLLAPLQATPAPFLPISTIFTM
jgi:hypothetical protein